MKRAGRFDRLNDGDNSRRLDADLVEPPHQPTQTGAAKHGDLPAGLARLYRGLRRHHSLAARQRRRLGNLRRLGDAQTDRSVRHSDGRNANILPDHDRARARIDHDARRTVGLHQKIADLCEKSRRAQLARFCQRHRAHAALPGRIYMVSRARPAIDGVDDTDRRGEIGISQFQSQFLSLADRRRRLALDQCAVGNAPNRRNALRDGLRLPGGGKAGPRDSALRDGVGLPIAALQCRHHQGAACQRLRIANRRHCHIESRAFSDEGRNIGGDNDSGDVARAQRSAARVHAHPVEHGLQSLLGEWRVSETVARPLQSDDDAIADELIVAHALNRGDVFDAHFGDRGAGAQPCQEKEEKPHYLSPTRTLPSS